MVFIGHKSILLLFLCLLQLTLVLLIFSLRVLDDGTFSIISVVLMIELVTLCLSLVYVAKDGFPTLKILSIGFFESFDEAVILSSFSLLWIFKSVLEIMSIANLDPLMYQLSSHMNLLTLLIFSWILFKRPPSIAQCISVSMILVGVFFTQLQPLKPFSTSVGLLVEQNPLIGLICILFVSLFSSIIGTYFKVKCAPQSKSFLSKFHLRFACIRFLLCTIVTMTSVKPVISELFRGYSAPLCIYILLSSLYNVIYFHVLFTYDEAVCLTIYPLSLWPIFIFSLIFNWVSVSWQCIVSLVFITLGGFTFITFMHLWCIDSQGLP